MLVANALRKDGKTKLLILGMTEENITRLRAGKPILVSSKNHGPAVPDDLQVMVILGESEAAMIQEMRKAGQISEWTAAYCNHGKPGDPPCDSCKALGITKGKQ